MGSSGRRDSHLAPLRGQLRRQPCEGRGSGPLCVCPQTRPMVLRKGDGAVLTLPRPPACRCGPMVSSAHPSFQKVLCPAAPWGLGGLEAGRPGGAPLGAGSRCPRTRGEPSPQGRTHRGGLSLALAGGLDRRGPSVARSKTASCPQVWHKWESHVAHRPCPPPETKATGPQGHRRCPATPQGPGPGGGTGSTRAVWGLGPLRRSLQHGALSRPPARPPQVFPAWPLGFCPRRLQMGGTGTKVTQAE